MVSGVAPATALGPLLLLLLLHLSIVLRIATAHSWIDCMDTDRSIVYDQSASYIFGGAGGNGFCRGYGAGYPGRGAADIGTAYTYKVLKNEVLAGAPVCQNVGANAYADWRTRLAVAPGQTAYFSYLPNGHIVKDKKAIGTQHGVYWTGKVGTALTSTLEMTPKHLLNGHTTNFDDGNCGESLDNNGNPGGRAGDGKPCIGSLTIPAGTAPGVYHMVWYWTFWLDDESQYVDQAQAKGYFGAAYSTCFDIEVVPDGGVAANGATPVPPAPGVPPAAGVPPAPGVSPAPVPVPPAPAAPGPPIVAATPPKATIPVSAESKAVTGDPVVLATKKGRSGPLIGAATPPEEPEVGAEASVGMGFSLDPEETGGPKPVDHDALIPSSYSFATLATDDPAIQSSASDAEKGDLVVQEGTLKPGIEAPVIAKPSGKVTSSPGAEGSFKPSPLDHDALIPSSYSFATLATEDSAKQNSADPNGTSESTSSASDAVEDGHVKQEETLETEKETLLDTKVPDQETAEHDSVDDDGLSKDDSSSLTTEGLASKSSADQNSSLELTSSASDAEENGLVTQEGTLETEKETLLDTEVPDQETTEHETVDDDGLSPSEGGSESFTTEELASKSSADYNSTSESTGSASGGEEDDLVTQEDTLETEKETLLDTEVPDQEMAESGSTDGLSKDGSESFMTDESASKSSLDSIGSSGSMSSAPDAEKGGHIRQEGTTTDDSASSASSGSSSESSGHARAATRSSSANSVAVPQWWLIIGIAVLLGTTK